MEEAMERGKKKIMERIGVGHGQSLRRLSRE
jgi:hypothetical protein